MGTDTLQFLHTLGDTIEGSVKLSDNLYWGGDFEQIKELLRAEKIKPNEIRFYLGYSGWEVGQLDNELRENSWIVTKATSEHIFKIPNDVLWRRSNEKHGRRLLHHGRLP